VKYFKDLLFMKAFGEKVRKIRMERGMSQEYLADEIGIPTNQIGRIERGEVNTSISIVSALAKALSVDFADLFKFNVDE
jgi:transcriptional regulator with XRE-family HTH domain